LATSLYLQLMAIALLFAVFSPSRKLFGAVFALMCAGFAGQWLTGGWLLQAVFRNASRALVLAIFAGGGVAMFTRRLPSLIALPGMAIAIALVALVRWDAHFAAFAQVRFAALVAGFGALGGEAFLSLLAMVLLAGALLLILREAYTAEPTAGRALAVLVVPLTFFALGVPPSYPAGLAVTAGAFALAIGFTTWWALGGSDSTDGWPDVVIAGLVAAAAWALAPKLLTPVTAHWYYKGELSPAVDLVVALAADLAWVLRAVVNDGALRLANVYVMIIFGAMLAVFLARTGLAREIVKTAAELGGDRPRVLAALMLIVVAALFTTLAGLGSIIMVGMIVLPLLLSLEASAEAAAALLLMGISLGGILNPANWALYLDLFALPRELVLGFSQRLFGLGLLTGAAFVWREFPAAPPEEKGARAPREVPLPEAWSKRSVWSRARAGLSRMLRVQDGGLRPIMVLTPVLPLVLILGFGVPEIPAFVLALLFGVALYAGPRRADLLVTSVLEGLSGVAPAVGILMGLGMLLKALTLPVALAADGAPKAVPVIMAPLVKAIVPSTPVPYVLLFIALAPLALYRGPLNIWGMGFGLAEVIRAAGGLGAPLVMGMLQSVGQVQGICDPTNTANIWVAGYTRVTTRRILVKTFPYALALAAMGLVLAAQRFAGHFGSAS
jgi:hypothetical protein